MDTMTKPTAGTFESRLRLARLEAGDISAREAARRVGVTGMTWRNWENGVGSKSARKPAMLHYIAAQLGVDVDWLAGDDSRPTA